jgi:hypothetical protein
MDLLIFHADYFIVLVQQQNLGTEGPGLGCSIMA